MQAVISFSTFFSIPLQIDKFDLATRIYLDSFSLSFARSVGRHRRGLTATTCDNKIGMSSKGHKYEFFGPVIGPLGIMLGLPAVCYSLVFLCHGETCLTDSKFVMKSIDISVLFTWNALLTFLCWMLFQICLHLLVPGGMAEGVILPDGSRLKYKLTGLTNFFVTIGIAIYFGFFTSSLNLSWLYDNYVPLMTSAILFSFCLSMYLYASSFMAGRLLAEEGSRTGNPVYEFFLGRELNPRIFSLDLKEFCELYPGLIGWVVLNLGMAHKQYTMTGTVSSSMILVNLFQGLYVLDSLIFEKAILTTMDITTDGFGFMLAFGDLAWVPFTYSLQARILVTRSPQLSNSALLAVVAIKALGYAIFRGSNSQKDIFRRNPDDPRVRHLKTLPTERGTKLIISGWWGISRHINYFGDWLMGISWCLPVGLNSGPIPYFYAIYFAILLIHREMRDEDACKRKYSKDYDKYCRLVPYRIIPFVY